MELISSKNAWRRDTMRIVVVFLVFGSLCSARVLELDERFVEARKTGVWLVMFYAPWCGHCKQLEPTWMEVGEAMYGKSSVNVARLDCTRYSALSSSFGIRGFPTIKFITAENQYEYRGPRTKDGIIEFVNKAQSPPVSSLGTKGDIESVKKKHEVFFLYVGENDSSLRSLYGEVASELFLSIDFYATTSKIFPVSSKGPSVFVFKDGTYYEMPSPTLTAPQLHHWVSSEQLPSYNELTGASYYKLKSTGKTFAIIVLPEGGSQDLDSIAKQIALSRDKVFHPKFIFCWVKGNKIVNSMTYGTIPVPNMLVFDPNSYEFYTLRDEGVEFQKRDMEQPKLSSFLQNVIEGKVPAQGGSGFIQQIKRFFSDAIGMLVNFFRDSPILASVVIGVPTFAVTALCYCLCTMEDSEGASYSTDSEDEREDEEELPAYENEAGNSVRRRMPPENENAMSEIDQENQEIMDENDKNK